MQEIVINLIGSEQFAIVSGDEQLTPQALFGVRAQELLGVTGESGIIGRAKSERRPLALLRGMPADATRVRASPRLRSSWARSIRSLRWKPWPTRSCSGCERYCIAGKLPSACLGALRAAEADMLMLASDETLSEQ
jgi:hypothetical protein